MASHCEWPFLWLWSSKSLVCFGGGCSSRTNIGAQARCKASPKSRMPLTFRPNCLPSALGVLPHTSARAAWDACLLSVPSVLPLPLLVSGGEDPIALAIDGLKGTTIVMEQPRCNRDTVYAALDELYAAYLQNHWATRALSLRALADWPQRERQVKRAEVLAPLVMGPVSTALRLTDGDGVPALFDDLVVDAIAKHLHLRLGWLQATFGRGARRMLYWLYEPYLEITGSPFVPLQWPRVHMLLDETFGTINGVRAVWSGATTELAPLLEGSTVEVIGLPLPVTNALAPLAPVLRDFIRRKGAIGWGLIPHTADGLAHARVGRLAARFTEMLQVLESAGLPPAEVVAASLIMPEDVLAGLEPAEAETALSLTNQVAGLLRHSYGLD